MCNDLFYNPSLDPKGNQGLVQSNGLLDFLSVL